MSAPARHVPVLLDAVLSALAPQDGAVLVDGTFGAGGYARAILDAADCRLIAFDQDPNAIAGGQEMVAAYAPRLTLIHDSFAAMDAHLTRLGASPVDGITLDLGVSSMQLDDAERGFSFQADGPLDMRMAQTGESAADVVNHYEEGALADILYQYGEETRSRRIAKAIVARRAERPFHRTLDLAQTIAEAAGKPRGAQKRHPATQSFQGLRIYVNRELEALQTALLAAEKHLAPGGRLAVVSFHSLEDRPVKHFLADRAGRTPAASRHLPEAPGTAPAPSFALPRKAAIKPDAAEIAANPRSRSARLRVAVRTDAAPFPPEPLGARP